jgi:addiction module HigA family antidote
MKKMPVEPRKRLRPPTTPGEFLVEEWLKPLDMSQETFAERIGVSVEYVSEIVDGRRGVTEEMATRFEAVLGMPARFWIRAQFESDLWLAEQAA